jgi:hypothetical protein
MGISVKDMQTVLLNFNLVEFDILNVLKGPRKNDVIMFRKTLENDILLCCDADNEKVEFEMDSADVEYDQG